MDDSEFYRRMRVLVGRRGRFFDGDEWQIIDILPDEQSLVLGKTRQTGPPIQTDAFGNALRRAPETRIVPYVDDSGEITEEARILLESLQPR